MATKVYAIQIIAGVLHTAIVSCIDFLQVVACKALCCDFDLRFVLPRFTGGGS